MTDRYEREYRRSILDPDGFWLEAASALAWDRPPTIAHDNGVWFPDGRLNICYNSIDRHVDAGHGERTALIYDSPVTGAQSFFTFAQLQETVACTAGMLRSLGVKQGDRVIIYMPMVPEAVFAMLACARIGAIHSVVFGGFAAVELAKRIDDARPTLIMAASCGIEPARVVPYKPLLDEALSMTSHAPPVTVILQRPQVRARMVEGRDVDWQEAYSNAQPEPCTSTVSTDPLYILYTSGTTGIPKGVQRDCGGYAAALLWSMTHIYDLKAGDTMWTASDVGWVVGHSYIVYGPLLAGAATILYEGKPVSTPDAGAFWRVMRDHDVNVFFTAPTAIRAIRREDPQARLIGSDTGALRSIFLAGERADPDTLRWLSDKLSVPVIDHWWQTETGWPAIATCLGLDRRDVLFGSAGHPVPGYEFAVLDADHNPLPADEIGDLAIKLPLPPGCLPTLWRNEDGFRSSYLSQHPGYYTAGDAAIMDNDGRIHVMSRIDDIINVAGHRLSTGGIEQIISAHPAIAECCVVGASDALKGMIPFALLICKADALADHATVIAEVIDRVRNELGPVASFKTAFVVEALPKTRSGKILRAVVRDIVDGREPKVPPTIEALSVVHDLATLLKTERSGNLVHRPGATERKRRRNGLHLN